MVSLALSLQMYSVFNMRDIKIHLFFNVEIILAFFCSLVNCFCVFSLSYLLISVADLGSVLGDYL